MTVACFRWNGCGNRDRRLGGIGSRGYTAGVHISSTELMRRVELIRCHAKLIRYLNGLS